MPLLFFRSEVLWILFHAPIFLFHCNILWYSCPLLVLSEAWSAVLKQYVHLWLLNGEIKVHFYAEVILVATFVPHTVQGSIKCADHQIKGWRHVNYFRMLILLFQLFWAYHFSFNAKLISAPCSLYFFLTFQCVASHPDTRMLFLNGKIFLSLLVHCL